VAEHNRVFFLLLLEECRASLSTSLSMKGDPRDQDEVRNTTTTTAYHLISSPHSVCWLTLLCCCHLFCQLGTGGYYIYPSNSSRPVANAQKAPSMTAKLQQWQRAEVRSMLRYMDSQLASTTGQQPSSSSSSSASTSPDPRLGSLWVLNVFQLTGDRDPSPSAGSAGGIAFSAGDMLAIRSDSWGDNRYRCTATNCIAYFQHSDGAMCVYCL
jgi:hypothetical protein